MSDETELCIRCDKPVNVGDRREYMPLTFNHETGCLPLCNDCFDEVEDRDLIH